MSTTKPAVQHTAGEFRDLAGFGRLIGPDRTDRLRAAAATIRDRLAGGTLWHVNSTGAGGGVAEMLHTLLPLYRSLGVRVGWLVIGGDDRFFAVTKRLGEALYGRLDDPEVLGAAGRRAYLATLADNAAELRTIVRPSDVLFLHDHQTAGLVELLGDAVAATYWRCHVGVDEPTPASELAWDFLSPFLARAAGLVFSVDRHIPQRLRRQRVEVIPPFISPDAPKNCALDASVIAAGLARCRLGNDAGANGATTLRTPNGTVSLRHQVRVVSERTPVTGEPLAVQVSRWDRLKDMDGVRSAFASFVPEGFLALVGPDPDGIPDDIDQRDWFEKCLAGWRALSPAQRARIALICLPMADLAENAVLVNAIQRSADVVLQKSLAEGFGLTVTEAMWKSRVVVASAVGGIREQITHGDNGLLVADSTDLPAFGALVASVTRGELVTETMGMRARQRVLRDFLPDREIGAMARLMTHS